jgi:chromosome segregation ATPase
MIKKIYSLALATLIGGVIFTGCQSTAEKTEAAEAKVQDAKEELKEARKDENAQAQKTATADEWRTFRNESQEKIWANEKHIAELKVKMNKPGKLLDAAYAKKIDSLEEKNRELKRRMDAYEKSQSDWETFKREFNHDMDELGNALKDLTVDNKK